MADDPGLQWHQFTVDELRDQLVQLPVSGNLQQYAMAQGVAGVTEAWHQAVIAIGNTIRAQATIMGYADSFALLGVVLLAAIIPVALLRKGTGGGGAAH